ncbi:MAG: SCO family protein [Akkermansiaceae bacterium]|jgi:protein SCO1|nr:SCO family protein [Akkermansiaceae bacterium]MDP4647141.1 SCO family protein [Akkermansiaceae bacterium]MDP4722611.1 SCO family protein [Akkermansiaceae bacterium]MDP4780435.1 SCO family protein [Akkermansiaceae bacterium]MDP4847752.1 SCO family protein [Akkermansiaceae bacterium]
MTKKTTIITFYTIVALICVGILALVNLVIVPSMRSKGQETEAFVKVRAEKEQSWFPIEKDLNATNQAGEKVKLSDLRGKVWVVAEFFAVCPHCAMRNGAELRTIYDEFKDDPDFQMVCISVDPSQDDVEKLAEYSEALSADVEDWWFLNAGDEKATHDYLENTLKFFGIRERSDPAEIEASGRFSHDLGLILVDRGFNVIGKWPLADARSEEGRKLDPDLYETLKEEMFSRIRTELDKEAIPVD